MEAEVVGDKGKLKAAAGPGSNGEEAMWAVVLSKELWRKGIWCVCVFQKRPTISSYFNFQDRFKNRLHHCSWVLPPCHQSSERLSALLPGQRRREGGQ